MLIILKNVDEANILAEILGSSIDSPIKGAVLSSATYVTDEQGKYAKIEFSTEKGGKNE